MIYISFRYYLIVAAMLIVFYALPLKRRWCVLLAANVVLNFDAGAPHIGHFSGAASPS